TSFAGHLAGILVGLMYTQGPLKKIMETCAGPFSSNVGYRGQWYYFNNAGPSGYQNHYPDGRPGTYEETHRNYDVYTAGLSEEEQLERALRASLCDRAFSPLLMVFSEFLLAAGFEEGQERCSLHFSAFHGGFPSLEFESIIP
ncbi:hypothetical protein STEG23_025306, partial [Scotinomys teguina]